MKRREFITLLGVIECAARLDARDSERGQDQASRCRVDVVGPRDFGVRFAIRGRSTFSTTKT
jgi:hypothetical protein